MKTLAARECVELVISKSEDDRTCHAIVLWLGYLEGTQREGARKENGRVSYQKRQRTVKEPRGMSTALR